MIINALVTVTATFYREKLLDNDTSTVYIS